MRSKHGVNVENFVQVVGYQLEKIHTAVINWCLELDPNEEISDSKYQTICNIYKKIEKTAPFNKEEIKHIKGIPEFSFGRKARIDLVIEITTNNEKHFLVCEMKVDSDPYVEQLDNTVHLSKKNLSSSNIDYLLILLGCSSVSREIGDNHSHFHSIDCNDLLEIFKPQENDSFIVLQWFESMRSEITKSKNVVEDYKKLYPLKVKNKEAHKKLGYRPLFTLYYYLYSHIRNHFSCKSDWKVYSGGNNPVMNWEKGWKSVGPFKFYWEFNYLEYCFKVKIDDKEISKTQLNKLRGLLVPVLNKLEIPGKEAQKRYGKWNSIYKWKFSPATQSLAEICQIIETQINPVYPEIISACKASMSEITSA